MTWQLAHKVRTCERTNEGLKFYLRTTVVWPIGGSLWGYRLDFLPRRHVMFCLSEYQSEYALTRTFQSCGAQPIETHVYSRNTSSCFLFFPLSAIRNSQAGYRCTLVPRIPFPVQGSLFFVPRSSFPIPSFNNIPYDHCLDASITKMYAGITTT